MPEVTKHEIGMFSWADLATSDSEAAGAFYKQILGWTSNDMPTDDQGGVYSMLLKDGKDAAALYDMGPAMKEQGVPPHWTAYFTVANADETAAKAKGLGATLLQEPMDVFNAGRMAVIRDPEGASFAIWQPKENIGAEVFGEPGALVWSELYTNDPNAQASFYNQLFGWTALDATASAGNPYVLFQQGGGEVAGMIKIPEEWGAVPPNWSVYFGVDDCDGTVEKAVKLGGSLTMPAADIPNIGRFALLSDPQGAHFYILQMAMSASG